MFDCKEKRKGRKGKLGQMARGRTQINGTEKIEYVTEGKEEEGSR